MIDMEMIRELIAKGQLSKAAELTVELCKQQNEEYVELAIIISMQIHTLKKAVVESRISWEQETQTNNNLAKGILMILETTTHGDKSR